MYLSCIEILGFKSFAQKIDLKFGSGITAIVGPNGCGKTNIVDAMRWVLGEQKHSMLRSSKMEDVIFNGTKNKKPSGFAEVSLTVENTKNILPIDYSEVTITRRMYRSGESEYLMNKNLCRLKDIVQLFMDTGIGANAYSVIELKMVETILSDNTEERRRLFEEAAGVTKYKQNKKSTLRKLESVQNDISRVNDIIKEVQTTVNSLNRQSKKAERYNEFNLFLKEKEKQLFETQFYILTNDFNFYIEELNKKNGEKQLTAQSLLSDESDLESLKSQSNSVEENFKSIQNQYDEFVSKLNLLNQNNLILNEKINSLLSLVLSFESTKDKLLDERKNLEIQKESYFNEQLKSKEQIGNERTLYHSFSLKLNEIEKIESDVKSNIKSLNDEFLEKFKMFSYLKNDCEKLKIQLESLENNFQKNENELQKKRESLTKFIHELEQLSSFEKEKRKNFAQVEIDFFETEKNKILIEEEIKKTEKFLIEKEKEIAVKKSRESFFQSLIEKKEGIGEGVKFLLSNEKVQNKVYSLIEAIDVKEKYRVAIETIVKNFSDFLVVESFDVAKLLIELLKNENKGKVTFVCLDKLPKFLESKNTLINKGVFANSIVDVDEKIKPVIDFLFSDFIIVEKISDTENVENKNFNFVSLDGEVFNFNGIYRGGSKNENEGTSIGRTTQLKELQNEIIKLEEEKKNIENKIDKLKNQILTFDILSLQKNVKKVEQEVAELQTLIAQITFKKNHIEVELSEIEKNNFSLQSEIKKMSSELDKRNNNLELSEIEKIRKEEDLKLAQNNLLKIEIEKQKISDDLKRSNIKLVSLESEEKNIFLKHKYCEEQIENNIKTVDELNEKNIEAKKEISNFELQQHNVNDEQSQYNIQFKNLESQKNEIESKYKQIKFEVEKIESILKSQRIVVEKNVESIHEIEIKISEINSKLEHIKEKAKEEIGIEIEYKKNDFVLIDIEKCNNEILETKNKISTLGNINFEAFEQYKLEEDRLNFLSSQRDDLLSSEQTLLNTIDEINEVAKEKFLITFQKIRENFIGIFRTLFEEGDECDLKLDDEKNLLECGIEIIAKPRGKRPTSIDLLSGGEKTLTAIALLFAIYLVKPSPFCILDEVDAPLDDLNIDRFIKILRRFSDNTQFIVVTHNKRTMESANALYGVTMEEEGVSKIISVKFINNDIKTSVSIPIENEF